MWSWTHEFRGHITKPIKRETAICIYYKKSTSLQIDFTQSSRECVLTPEALDNRIDRSAAPLALYRVNMDCSRPPTEAKQMIERALASCDIAVGASTQGRVVRSGNPCATQNIKIEGYP